VSDGGIGVAVSVGGATVTADISVGASAGSAAGLQAVNTIIIVSNKLNFFIKIGLYNWSNDRSLFNRTITGKKDMVTILRLFFESGR
jgi:hypothetical protein